MADIKVYGAPWCPDCRRAKKFLGEHRVDYDWIDIEDDAEGLRFVEQLQGGGRTIPTIVFPDGSHLLEPANEEIARQLGLELEAERGFYDLAIVGGGPTGLTAAIYAAREGIDAIVIDSGSLGGQAGATERIDNFPGFPEGIEGIDLAQRFVAQARRYEVELLEAVGVESLHEDNHDVEMQLSTGQQVCARATLISTGSSYRRLGIPGEAELTGSNVHFCAACDGAFYRGRDELLVVGGGNSALEEGLFLSQFVDRIRIVEFMPRLNASQLLQDKLRDNPMFEIHTNTQVTELVGRGGRLQEVVARDRDSGEEHRWTPDGVFVFIGLEPNTAFLKETLDLDRWGFIETDNFETSMANVFAAGDVRAGSTKQLASAVGEGAAAALAILARLQEQAHLPTVKVNA